MTEAMSLTPVRLLDRLRDRPAEADWKRLHDLYEPLIRGWLRRDATLRDDADDLTQEVTGLDEKGALSRQCRRSTITKRAGSTG